MKNIIRVAVVLMVISLTLTGCYYDKENELYPAMADCDTTDAITYSGSIAPIMAANCNVCHSTSAASAGVITDNYNDLYIIATNGSLWAAVSWSGAVRMPKGSDQLSDCDLTKINKWIEDGAPDN
jgi:mono/diheme cytochrome c family protein